MTDITIPPEALEAAARAVVCAIMFEVEPDARANQLTNDEYRTIARAACLAMLKAWPKAKEISVYNANRNVGG
jgi:hypothetical protein